MLRQVIVEGSKKNDLLIVEDDCCSVLSVKQVSDELLEVKIRVKFKALLNECIKENNLSVKISLLDSTVDNKLNEIDDSDATQKATIDNIKSFLRKRYRRSKVSNEILTSTTVDLTSKVDNGAINKIIAGKNSVNRQAFEPVDVGSIKQDGRVEALVVRSTQTRIDSIGDFNTGAFFNQLIKVHGLDPSDVAECNDDVVKTKSAFYGTFEQSRANRSVAKLFEKYRTYLTQTELVTDTSQVPNNATILRPVMKDASNDYVEFDKVITFVVPGSDNVFITPRLKFELIGPGKVIRTTSRKDVNMMSAINDRFLPKKSPDVRATRANGVTGFVIATDDQFTRGVKVYVRSIRDTNPDNDIGYRFVCDLPFTGHVQGSKHLTWCDIGEVSNNRDNKIQGLTTIYRFVPYGITPFNTIINSSLFKNVVINNVRSYANAEIAIVCLSTSAGVQVITPLLPHNCVSMNVMKRSVTLREKKFRFVGQALLDSNNVLDSDVIDGHTYEYICKLNYVSGQIKESGRTLHKFVKQIASKNQLKLSIKNLEIDQSSNDVRFEMTLEKYDSDQNLLKKMLDAQNLSSYFNEEISLDRTKLEDLLAYRVSRINMDSGKIDVFSVSSDLKFSDLRQRSKDNIESPVQGKYYKYVVDVLLRTPISTVDNLTLTGNVNGTEYSYSPQKFYHPLNIKSGVFGTPEAIKARYAENFMEFGQVGISATTDVITSQDQNVVTIANVRVTKLDDHHENISFDVTGPTIAIDHFLIIRSCSGARAIVGRASPLDGTVNAIVEINPTVEIEPRKYLILLVKK